MKYTALASLLILLPTAAFAQPNAERLAKINAELEKRFTAADADGDGQLTRDEAKGKMPRIYDNFETIDSEQKGYLTLDQIRAYGASQAGARRAGRS